MHEDLKSFFLAPKTPKQRQYEALRAYVIEELTAQVAAARFGFTETSLYSLANDLRVGKLNLFAHRTQRPPGNPLYSQLDRPDEKGKPFRCGYRRASAPGKDHLEPKYGGTYFEGGRFW